MVSIHPPPLYILHTLTLLGGIPLGPLLGLEQCTLWVPFPLLCNGVIQRVVWVRRLEESHDAEAHCEDLEGRSPLLPNGVQTDATQVVDVGVPNLGDKVD